MAKDQGVRLEGEKIEVIVDQSGPSITAGRKDGGITFGPLGAWAAIRTADSAYSVSTSLVPGWKIESAEIETPLGAFPGVRLEASGVHGLPVSALWEVAICGDEEVLARLTLTNAGDETLQINETSPLAFRGADPALDMGAGYVGWRFYRTGYQSWTPAGSIGVMDEDYKPRFFLPSRSGTNSRTPYSRVPGLKTSDWMGQLVEPKLGLGALLGFITSDRMNGRVEFEVKYDRFRRLEAIADGEGIPLDPGETLETEWAILSLSDDPSAQQEKYFKTWGRAMKARESKPLSGWCSWYFAFWNVHESHVNSSLFKLASIKDKLDVIQIDDGYQPWIGHWTEWNDKFPSGPAELARRIKDAGFKPGLWLAPFFVSRGAPIYGKHRDWVVRDKKGKPVIAFIHPKWKGKVIYPLDLTHPGVQKHVGDFIRTLVGYGFEYLKLDFLYGAALPGKRHDPRATGAMALRKGLEVIREAAGEETYILGCGCPLGPAVGLVDSMRVSQDVDIHWKIPLMDWAMGIPTGPGAGNCLRNNLNRALMHGGLWANDPDCVIARDERLGLKEHEIQSELTVFYLTGGAAFLSEDASLLPADRMEWFERMLPPSNRAARVLDLFEKDFPETLVLSGDGQESALVGLFNWSGETRRMKLDLKALGLSGAWHVFDYWAKRGLGAASSTLDLGEARPRGCRYLRLVKADGKPRLLATDVHMGMGEVGVSSGPGEAGLSIKIELPGKRRGKVWAVFPGGKVKTIDVEFSGAWEGTIGPE